MDVADIQKGLSGFLERYDSQTYLGSFRETGRESLLKDGLGTRANSLWKMSEYVVATYDGNEKYDIEKYISGWKTLASKANNQFLIIAETDTEWGMYDSQGKRLGGETFIKEYFAKQIHKRKGYKSLSSIEKITDISCSFFLSYLSALLTKPFLLLAGISGTGKSRIVRELARACWKPDSEEFKAHKPSNFEMIQVKPNWHDSSELLGYVSRISGKPEFVAGDFLRFIVKAWENRNVPCFLCLDEMNLAPVEQYFAEYLSVIETRKLENDEIVTDPILKVDAEQWYIDLIHKLTSDEILSKQFLERGIAIPQNLFVVGTVNMDETTFSFSRKVLDRAMTIEMNEVDLEGGMENDGGDGFGYIGEALHAQFVEGKDVYSDYKELCDKVITYLKSVNEKLEGTPFKIAYRTRNEFLVYAVNRWLLSDGQDVFLNVIDEMTSMKILSRIEGDADKVGSVLDDLKSLLEGAFGESELKTSSVSLSKLKEMTKKLDKTQYTSFWL